MFSIGTRAAWPHLNPADDSPTAPGAVDSKPKGGATRIEEAPRTRTNPDRRSTQNADQPDRRSTANAEQPGSTSTQNAAQPGSTKHPERGPTRIDEVPRTRPNPDRRSTPEPDQPESPSPSPSPSPMPFLENYFFGGRDGRTSIRLGSVRDGVTSSPSTMSAMSSGWIFQASFVAPVGPPNSVATLPGMM